MIQQVFSIVAPLFVIVAIGYLYGSKARPDLRITNQLAVDVFFPALIFHVMVQDDFHAGEYSLLVVGGVLLMLGSGVAAYLFAKSVGFVTKAFVPPAMFSNWANLGLPLYVFALGEVALDGGVMLVVAGNILFFTLGSYIYAERLSGWDVLRTPIILSVVLGLTLNGLDVVIPYWLDTSVNMLGQVAIPLMLFSLGVRLTRFNLKDSSHGFVMAIFAPVVGVSLAYLIGLILPMSELHQNILLLFGVLPPAVMNFILAEQYNAEPDKVASMVILGNLASIVTIPLVLMLVLSLK